MLIKMFIYVTLCNILFHTFYLVCFYLFIIYFNMYIWTVSEIKNIHSFICMVAILENGGFLAFLVNLGNLLIRFMN